MKRMFYLFAIVLSINCAQAASFDCKKASTTHEKLICNTPELNDADTQLGNTFGRSIEDAFLDIIQHEKMKHIFFRTPPVICGVGGGSGKYYKSGVIRILKDRMRNWIARSKSQYKDLFCA